MKILTVIPIVRGTSKNTLTYFSREDVGLGSIITIPIRKKTAHGLVIESKEVSDVKSELKNLTYTLRKTGKNSGQAFLSPSFLEAVKMIADYHATSVGSVLFSLIPKAVLEVSSKLPYIPQNSPKGTYNEIALLQSDEPERFATYRSLIREEFAKGRSVFFCLPTIEDILTSRSELWKGIEQYTFVLHSGLTKKNIVSLWKEVLENQHPVLIIATGSFLCLPKDNIGTIVVEKESSRGYKMQIRPFLDMRTVATKLAKVSGKRLIFGDTLLQVETLWKEKNGDFTELSPLKFRSISTVETKIVDMREPKDMKRKEFAILSEKVKKILREGKENNEHTFLFCARKGLYPITVCSDCGNMVLCNNCNAPVVLYSKNGLASEKTLQNKTNLFVCHKCGERRDAGELCKHCRGWRLTPLGIGTDKVLEEVQTMFPNFPVYLMDKTSVKNHKQAVKIRDQFYSKPGIMVGTEMALTYLSLKIENMVVVSIDPFFSIPDFRMQEKIFHILLTLLSISDKRMLIQTRKEEVSAGYGLFTLACQGNLADFYRQEIEERKSLDYPPFATHIKLVLEGKKSTVQKKMESIAKILEPYRLKIYPAWAPGSALKYTLNGLITLEHGRWVDKDLLEKLKALPPNCTVKIDPDTLL